MKRTPDPKSKKEFKINVNFFNLLQFDETKLQRIERKLKKKEIPSIIQNSIGFN